MKKLIINADDFGLDAHTVEWTIKGFESGALTSATIMAGMPGTDAAISYAKAHPEFSFGVHFYLVDETPMCEAKDIPSMVDPKTGKLWVTRQFILRNFAGLIKVDDLVREMRAQYNAIASTGLPISHVDGHGHNHRLPQSIKALKILSDHLATQAEDCEVRAKGYGVSAEGSLRRSFESEAQPFAFKVRRCQDIAVGHEGLLGKLINGPMQKRLVSCGFRMTDHFAMNAGHSEDPKWFSHLIATLPDGITEIGTHPGMNEDWRRIDTEDCFAVAKDIDLPKITFNDI